MKSYTNIEQSKKLAEILPKESADQTWEIIAIAGANLGVPEEMQYWHNGNTPCILNSKIGIPCWSLAALLNILANRAYSIDEDANVSISSYKTVEWDLSISNSGLNMVTKSDLINACVEMILKLHEEKLI